jgi:hypothetical protein
MHYAERKERMRQWKIRVIHHWRIALEHDKKMRFISQECLCEKKGGMSVFATTRRADRVELIPDTKRKLSRLSIYTGENYW